MLPKYLKLSCRAVVNSSITWKRTIKNKAPSNQIGCVISPPIGSSPLDRVSPNVPLDLLHHCAFYNAISGQRVVPGGILPCLYREAHLSQPMDSCRSLPPRRRGQEWYVNNDTRKTCSICHFLQVTNDKIIP